jgi:hypothetical protein
MYRHCEVNLSANSRQNDRGNLGVIEFFVGVENALVFSSKDCVVLSSFPIKIGTGAMTVLLQLKRWRRPKP